MPLAILPLTGRRKPNDVFLTDHDLQRQVVNLIHQP